MVEQKELFGGPVEPSKPASPDTNDMIIARIIADGRAKEDNKGNVVAQPSPDVSSGARGILKRVLRGFRVGGV